jgi:CheY-like chemotaxis protein
VRARRARVDRSVTRAQVLRALRSRAERDVIVVALSRDADRLGEQALAAGFDHVACKPAQVGALHARIADLAA